VLGAAFECKGPIVGIKDVKQNIAFPLSLLSRAPAYFGKRTAYQLILEFVDKEVEGPNSSQKQAPELSSFSSEKQFDFRKIKMADAIKVFQQKAPQGTLDKLAFERCFVSLLGEDISQIPGAKEQLSWLFSIFDKDGNGLVDSVEFLGGLSVYARGEENPEEKVRQAFMLYDIDGNGYISMDEMQRYLASVFRVLAEVMPEVFNKHGVGYEELAEATAATCFKEADLNHDGQLSFEEFQRWYTSAEGGLLTELAEEFGPQHFTLDEINRLLNLSSFQVEDVLDVMASSSDSDGRLSRPAFTHAFASLLTVPREPELTQNERQLAAYIIDKLFDVFDMDGDGSVSAAELASGLSMLCGGAPEDKVRAAFNLFDVEHKGYITIREMAQYLASIYRLLYETQPDLINEVGCSVEELAKVTAEQAFTDADRDRDGKITYEEFCSWYASGKASAADLLAERNALFSIEEVRKITKVTEYNVHDIFDFFARSCGSDKKVTWEIFRDCFEFLATEKGGFPRNERQAWNAALEQLFLLFDHSRIGYVDFKELGAGLTLLCGGDQDQKAYAAFQLYNVSGTGYISLQDMVNYLASIYWVMYFTDPNLEQKIGCSFQELAETTALHCFQEADADRDFRLSFEEFRNWYSRPDSACISRAGEAPAFTISEIQKFTNIGARDFDSMFQMMTQNADGSGYLTRHSFHKCFRALAEANYGKELGPNDDRRLILILDQLFELFDTSNDGVVSFEELAAGLSTLCHGEGGFKMASVFKLYDTDCDGYLSVQELALYLTSVFRVVFATHPEARPTSNTSPVEFGWITAKGAFDTINREHSEKISFDDFVKWYQIHAGTSDTFPTEAQHQRETLDDFSVTWEEFLQLTRLNEFSASQLFEIFSQFSDEGFIDYEGFAESFSLIVGPSIRYLTRADRAKVADFLQRLFGSYVKPDSQVAKLADIICGLCLFSSGAEEQRVAAAFSLYDENGDGFISLGEMTRYLAASFRVIYGAASTSKAKINPDILAAKLAKSFFAAADTDLDGFVSFGEFYQWYASVGLGKPMSAEKWKEFLIEDVPKWMSIEEVKRITGLGQRNVQHVFQVFSQTSDLNGDLTREAFPKALIQLANLSGGDDVERFYLLCDRLFDAFDVDHNGVVSFSELAAGLSFLCGHDDEVSKIRAVFEFFDENGDGHISLSEMKSYFVSVFRVLFETHPGLSKKVGASPEDVGIATAEHAFEEADLNHDGDISFEEFAKWYSSGAGAVVDCVSLKEVSLDEIRRITNLSSWDVKDAVQVFAGQAGHDGKLNRASFFTACSEFIDQSNPDFTERKGKLRVILNGLFDVFDQDGNGSVDLCELVAGLSILCSGPGNQKVKAIFELFDSDGDGHLSFSEMKRYLQSVFYLMYETNSSHFEGMNVQPDQLAHVTALQAFIDADLDHDGMISFAEFNNWYLKGSSKLSKPSGTEGTSDTVQPLPTVSFFKPTEGMVEARRLLKLDCYSMEDLLETFAESSVQGRIEFEPYMRQFGYLNTLGGGLHTSTDAPKFVEMAERIFRAFESEEGTVNLASLITSLTVLCEISFDEKISTAFTLYDLDGDGLINFTELVKYMACIFITLEALSIDMENLFQDPVELAIRTAMECYKVCSLERSSKISMGQFKTFLCRQSQL